MPVLNVFRVLLLNTILLRLPLYILLLLLLRQLRGLLLSLLLGVLSLHFEDVQHEEETPGAWD